MIQIVVTFAHFYQFAAEFELFAVGWTIGLLDEELVVEGEPRSRYDCILRLK